MRDHDLTTTADVLDDLLLELHHLLPETGRRGQQVPVLSLQVFDTVFQAGYPLQLSRAALSSGYPVPSTLPLQLDPLLRFHVDGGEGRRGAETGHSLRLFLELGQANVHHRGGRKLLRGVGRRKRRLGVALGPQPASGRHWKGGPTGRGQDHTVGESGRGVQQLLVKAGDHRQRGAVGHRGVGREGLSQGVAAGAGGGDDRLGLGRMRRRRVALVRLKLGQGVHEPSGVRLLLLGDELGEDELSRGRRGGHQAVTGLDDHFLQLRRSQLQHVQVWRLQKD